ncbi:RmlC-like cupin domain-containing protein [Naematelia encephala]|uniref:RmlC-like cupin domain-containing protein n=1 Tax=Naematelia encephala TaxID=71784 RepID=A0A1Y2ARG3_9TREE|nr:RmlC-like cupin domain-containing protein [Naematelia encephala]
MTRETEISAKKGTLRTRFTVHPSSAIFILAKNSAACSMASSTEITVAKGSTLETSGGQTAGMARQNALVGLSDQLCGSLMIAQPHTSSGIHHHGSQDTIVYAVSGRGAIVSAGGKVTNVLEPGDWALIPAGAEHQEANAGDEEVVWVIVRGGNVPQVHNTEGWSK